MAIRLVEYEAAMDLYRRVSSPYRFGETALLDVYMHIALEDILPSSRCRIFRIDLRERIFVPPHPGPVSPSPRSSQTPHVGRPVVAHHSPVTLQLGDDSGLAGKE